MAFSSLALNIKHTIMSAINKILLPVDFSRPAEAALDYAISFCGEDAGKEVTLIHVSTAGSDESQTLSKLEALKVKFVSGCKASCSTLTKVGNLNDTLLQVQKEMGYDLIIMGTKGSKEEEEVAVTNTSNLVRDADCPVLVVPVDCPPFSIKNVALALGKGEIDDSFTLGVLHNIARNFGAKVHILTIENEETNELKGVDKNDSILEYYLETLDYRHIFPKNSDVEKGINDYVKEKEIDLLAILPRNHSKKSKPSEGRLTKLLTLHAEIPILTID